MTRRLAPQVGTNFAGSVLDMNNPPVGRNRLESVIADRLKYFRYREVKSVTDVGRACKSRNRLESAVAERLKYFR